MEVLHELRAGRMIAEGTLIRPCAKKGVIRVEVDDSDMTHFTWTERALGAQPELDLVIFPGEAVFEKLERPGARVFLLKFASEPARNLLFWAQEADAGGDGAHVAAVTAALNSGSDAPDAAMEVEVEHPAPAAGIPSPSPAPAPTAVAAAAATTVDAASLAAVLGNIMGGGGGAAAAAAAPAGPSLTEVLRPDRVVPLLADSTLLAARVAPFLPPEHRSPEAMSAVLRSPQFRHQLDLLSGALASGQLDASQFGVGAGPAAGVADFLAAIQRQADAEAAAAAAAAAAAGGQQGGGATGGEEGGGAAAEERPAEGQ